MCLLIMPTPLRQTGIFKHWNSFFFCLPIMPYTVSFISFLLFCSHICKLLVFHTHTVCHLAFLPKTYRFLSFTPLCLISPPPLLPRPVASSGADGIQTIFCESKRRCVFSISYSWDLLAQVCVPGLALWGDAVADWIWINESVTFNSGMWSHRYREREAQAERDRMIVYLINRVKEKQVLTRSNFSSVHVDWLAASVDVEHLLLRNSSALVDVFARVLRMHRISSHSPFVIISIKADRDNKRKEIKRGGKIEMKEWMNKSADCVGGMMGRSIIGRNAKWQHGSERTRQRGGRGWDGDDGAAC